MTACTFRGASPKQGIACHNQIVRQIAAIRPDVLNIQYQPAIYEMKGAIHLLR